MVTRDKPQRGTLLLHEPLVWVGAAQHEVWRREPLPIAVYEPGSLARRHALAALAAHKRRCRIVYCRPTAGAGAAAARAGGSALGPARTPLRGHA